MGAPRADLQLPDATVGSLRVESLLGFDFKRGTSPRGLVIVGTTVEQLYRL